MATALGACIILGLGGEILVQNLFDVEKSFIFWGSIETAARWFIAEAKKWPRTKNQSMVDMIAN
jgi:hypothetical protein